MPNILLYILLLIPFSLAPLSSLMAEETQSKWEGKATAELKSTKPDQVWPFLEDFCSIHKWMPNLDTCYQVEGVKGQPGLIRYCAFTAPSPDNPDQSRVNWAKDKLLAIDTINHCFSYEVTDNNMGLSSYVATIKVIPINGGGCLIQWSFVCDPIQGWRLEDFASYIDSSLQFMAKKMEEALRHTI